LADLVADAKGVIEALDLGPCRIVGTSLGAAIAQELAIGWPHLMRSAVLLATRARSDAFRRAQTEAGLALLSTGLRPSPRYEAVRTAVEMLSPATLNDDTAVSGWLDILELSGGEGVAEGQHWVDTDLVADRRQALRRITAPCRAIAF